MKQNIHCWGVVFFLLFLMIFSETSARFLATKHGKEVHTEGSSLVDKEDNDSLNKLMGMEDCGDEDQECLSRRVVTEAHLDYIYTQQHKP